MLKRITLRYSSRCRKCGKEIPANALAYWQGKGQGVVCYPSCQHSGQSAAVSVPSGKSSATVDWLELKEAYIGMSESKYAPHFKLEGNRRFVASQKSSWMSESSWYGCSGNEMLNYIRNGYVVKMLDEIDPDLLPSRPRRKLRNWEEGELQYDAMQSGEDFPFLEWEQRKSKPGMRVTIDLDANGGVPATVIADYERWIARALYTLENLGFDVEVDIRILSRGLTYSSLPSPIETRIRVKKENEAADFASWSAIFSPGGFRHLCFMALVLTCDKLDASMSSFGSDATSSVWGVNFDKETRTLSFTISASSYQGFPEGKMTEQLIAILKEDRQV